MRFDIHEIESFLKNNKEPWRLSKPYEHFLCPEISEEKMIEILKGIKLLHHNHGDESVMWEIQTPTDLCGHSYIWLPIIGDRTPPLEKIGDIFTFHSYGYYGMFKPSVEEVLRQLQYEDLTKVYGVSINGPSTERDLYKYIGILNAGFHVAVVTLWALS